MELLKRLDPLWIVLLIVGGLNWGLVGIFEFDLVAALFGEEPGSDVQVRGGVVPA